MSKNFRLFIPKNVTNFACLETLKVINLLPGYINVLKRGMMCRYGDMKSGTIGRIFERCSKE